MRRITPFFQRALFLALYPNGVNGVNVYFLVFAIVNVLSFVILNMVASSVPHVSKKLITAYRRLTTWILQYVKYNLVFLKLRTLMLPTINQLLVIKKQLTIESLLAIIFNKEFQ